MVRSFGPAAVEHAPGGHIAISVRSACTRTERPGNQVASHTFNTHPEAAVKAVWRGMRRQLYWTRLGRAFLARKQPATCIRRHDQCMVQLKGEFWVNDTGNARVSSSDRKGKVKW